MTVPAARLSASQAYRLSADLVVFDASSDTPVDSGQWYDGSAGGGSISHDAAMSAHVVGVSGANAARGLLRSHARPKAAAGRSRTTVIVGYVSSDEVANQTKRWGLFDDNNGHFFQLDGEDLSVVIRTNTSGSVVDTAIERGVWKVAGKKTSDHVDTELTHQYEIRETWPNGTTTFFIDGSPVYQHSSDGSIQGPVARASRLPVSIETTNESVTTPGSFAVQSATVFVETAPVPGRTFSVGNSAASITTSDTPILCLRPKATFGSAVNLAEVLADAITATSSGLTTFKIWLGATITGGTWVSADAASVAEYNITPTSIADGIAIAFETDGSLALSYASELLRVLRVLADGATQDSLVVTAAAVTSTISARVALTWKEVR